MKALISRTARSRRVWLLLGVPVAAYVALSSVANVSLLPPTVNGKNLAFVTARTQLYVMPQGQLAKSTPSSNPSQFTAKAAVLANLLTGPELRTLIAKNARIDARRIVVDGPVPVDEPLGQIWPADQKRASQIVAESDPYRVTVDASPSLPVLGITAQAPMTGQAVRLAAAANTGLNSYLTGLETRAKLPIAQRLEVHSLAAIAVSGDSSGGLGNVAALAFVVSLALWTGMVYAIAAVARDLRSLRAQRPERASP